VQHIAVEEVLDKCPRRAACPEKATAIQGCFVENAIANTSIRTGCRRRSAGRGDGERGRWPVVCRERNSRSFAVHAKPHHVPTLPSKPFLKFPGRTIQSYR